MPTEQLFAVYLQDTNGHCRLVGDGLDLSEADAQALIDRIVGGHTKPHKVDYYKVGYIRATREAVLAGKGISL